MTSKKLINISNLQKFLSKLNEKFALKKAMKGISEDFVGNIIIGEEGLVPAPNENSKGKFLRSDGEWALPSETAVYDSMRIEEGVAGVSEVDKVLNAKNLKQIVNSDGFLTSLDSSKLTGIINIENLPQGALERILIVSSKEERLTLSDAEVDLGDVVKEADTGLMYYVINTEKLNSEEGYTQFTAGMASSVPWSGVTDKPTIPTKTSDLTNDSDFVIDSNVVHKTGDEFINGFKKFSNTIHRYADLTTSTVELVYKFEDTNANSCGHIFNNVHWHNNAVYNRHGAYNEKSGKSMELDIVSGDSGVGMVYVEGSARKGNLETVTSATGYTGIATMGWVNNPATSTNVVHRSGDEYIGGTKTFTSSTYATTPATSDYSTRIATTEWVRNYVNSVGRSSFSAKYSNATTLTAEGGSPSSSIAAYYSNATTLTAEGSSSTSGSSYPSDYSDYIDISPTVGTIYTGSQLFSTLNASASGSKFISPQSASYQTTAKATATFSGAFSSSAKYLCTTANAVKFRAFVSQGTTSDIGTASVSDNSSARSIFIRVE